MGQKNTIKLFSFSKFQNKIQLFYRRISKVKTLTESKLRMLG